MGNYFSDAISDKALGCLLGLAVGDALFAPAEFMSPEKIRLAYDGELREMVGGGWLNVRPGQHTDDTDMALCLARSIARYNDYFPQGALNNYVAWYESGPIDIGGTTVAALSVASKGGDSVLAAEDYHRQNSGYSGGNGSIMRIAPLAVAFGTSPETLDSHARTDAALTHYEPLGREACAIYCTHLANLIYGANASLPDVAERVADSYYATPKIAEEQNGKAPGFVLTALAVARASEFISERHPEKPFEEGLVWAGNLGGDTDTNGAVAGALLGARYGASSIPSRWLDVIDAKDEMMILATSLLAVAAKQA